MTASVKVFKNLHSSRKYYCIYMNDLVVRANTMKLQTMLLLLQMIRVNKYRLCTLTAAC